MKINSLKTMYQYYDLLITDLGAKKKLIKKILILHLNENTKFLSHDDEKYGDWEHCIDTCVTPTIAKTIMHILKKYMSDEIIDFKKINNINDCVNILISMNKDWIVFHTYLLQFNKPIRFKIYKYQKYLRK